MPAIYRAVGSLRGQRGPVDLSVAGGYSDSGDPESESRFRGAHTHVSLGAELPGNADLRGVLRFSDSQLEAFPDDSGGVEFAVIRELEQRDVDELSAGLGSTSARSR